MLTMSEIIVIQGVEYLSQTDAAAYLGITGPTFRKRIDKENELRTASEKIKTFRNPRNQREVLYLKSDIDRLAQVQPIVDKDKTKKTSE